MSAQSIRIPIELELKNIQGAISSLKSALSNISKNSGLYSDLSKEIDKIEKKFLTLQATASRPFFKTSEISSFGNQFLKLGDNINSISERFKNINFKDLDLSKIAGAQEKFNELQKKVEETSGKVQNFMNSEFQKASSSGGELFNVIQKMETAFKGQNLKLDTNSFENSCNIINSKMQEIIRKKEQLDQKLNEQQNKQQNSLSKYESFKDIKKDIESFKNLTDVNNFITKYDEKAKTLNKGMTGEEYLKAYFGIDLTEIKKAGADLEAEKNKILTSKNFVSQSNSATKDFLRSADLVESTQYQIDEFQRLIGVLQQVGTAFNTFQNDANRQTAFQKSQEEAEKARIAFDNYKLAILESSGVLGSASGATLSFSSALGSLQSKISQAEAKLRALNEQSRKMEQMKSRIAMWFGFTRVMNTVRRTITNAVNEIRELDKVMTEISVVTKMSQEDLWGQIKAYSEIANQYGVSTRGVYEVSQLYYQQGLQTAEVMQLTTETLKMAKIASLDYATATDYMTVAIRGFKMEMEDAQVVTDVYSALAAGTASNTEELAVAMSKTASSAEAVGSSFESTSAMIATMIATTREAPENIGSAMKSIISRYGEMTSDPTKLVDSEGEEMSLNRVDKALRSVGITLQDVNGEFRDFDDVILELAKSWNTIDTNTQRYIATVMAGNRQQSRFLALVSNYEEYARALDIAENAEDTGTLQALKTMDSLETKIQGVKTAWEQFYNSMGIEKMFKGVLGTITKIINNLSKMSKPAAFGTIINLFKGIKTLITGISSGITGTFQKMQGNAQNTISNLKSQLSTLQETQNINLGDENAHAKLNALIQKLRSLGANIPLNLEGTPKPPAPTSSANATGQTISATAAANNYAALLKYSTSGKNGTAPKSLTFENGQVVFNNSNFKSFNGTSKSEMQAQVNSLNNQIKDLPPGTVKSLNDAFKVANGEIKTTTNSVGNLGKNSDKASRQTDVLVKNYSKVSGYLNVFGGMVQTAGAALTAFALTLEDKSTDKYEKSKTVSGTGNLISALGGGLSSGGSAMMMTGNPIIAAIAAVVGALPGLVSGFSQLIDGLDFKLRERLEIGQKEYEEKNNKAIKEKGEANNLQRSLSNLEKLKEAQYNSAEAAQEYKEALNAMGEEYPNLIKSYDSAGNAIIDIQAAEEALAQARYDAAIAAKSAAKQELDNAKTQRDIYQGANDELINISLTTVKEGLSYVTDGYGNFSAPAEELSIEQKISQWEAYARDGFLDGDNTIFSNALIASIRSKENNEEIANALIDHFTGKELLDPEVLTGYIEQVDIPTLLSWTDGTGLETYNYFGNGKIFTKLESLLSMTPAELNNFDFTSDMVGDFISAIEYISKEFDISIEELTGFKLEEINVGNLGQAISTAGTRLNGWLINSENSIKTVSNKLANAEVLEFARGKIATGEYETDLIEDNIGLFGNIGSKMLMSRMEELGFSSLDEWKNASNLGIGESFLEVQEEIFNTIYGEGSKTSMKELVDLVDGVDQYSSVENYKDAIREAGIELESDLGKALVDNFVNNANKDKQRIRSGILSSSLKGSSKSQLWGLFDKSDAFGELLTEYGDSVMEAVNLIDDYTEKGLQAKASVLTEAVEGLYTSIGQQDDSVQADLLSIVEDIDWTSASSIESAIDAMEAYDEQNTKVDLSSEISALQDARDNLSFNLATEVQLMTKAIMEGVEGMEKTISSQNKGMGLNDALEAFKTITAQDSFKDMSFDELFTYDATLKQWVYTQEGFGAAISAQTKEIESSYQAANDAYDDIISFNKEIEKAYYDGFVSPLSSNGSKYTLIESLKNLDIKAFTDEDWNQLYSNLGITDDVFAQEQIQKYLESDRTKTFPEWLSEQVDLADAEKQQMEAIYTAWGDNIINILSSGLDIEAIMSGTDAGNQKSILTQIFAEKFKQNGYNEEFIKKYAESFAENAYRRIQEGDLRGLEAALGAENITYEMRSAVTTTPGEIAQKAVNELLSSVNSVVSEETKNLLMKAYGSEEALIEAGFTIDENGTLLVGSTEEMLLAVSKIIGEAGTSIAEKNAALGQYYEASQGAPEMKARTSLLSKSEGITTEDLIALGDATGQVIFDLQEEKISMAYEHLFEWNDYTQSFDLKEGVSFQDVFEELGGTLEKGTNEYLEFYSDFVKNEISKAETKPKAISDELQSLTDAKAGDKVGIVYLEAALSDVGINIANFLGQYGIAVENGIATIGENTNIYALVNSITNLAESGQIELEESIFELKDTLLELFDSWVEALSSGLSGELSNADAEALKQHFSFLSDMDFTETKNGLKLSRDAAFQLYTELKKIDGIRAGLAFDALAESLAEAGSGYEDIASTMATIAKLNKELANVPVSSERRAELERELAVAEEILRVRSQDPDSFNFMDKELPTGMQGPENYWNSVGEAYKVMNESAKSGYMEIQDYVNIVHQMEAMAIAAGQEFSIGGMNAAQLIEKGMSSLKNIDGEGVKIAMEGVGIDFANAATDMGLSFDEGIKEVAKSQIKMLDAAIRMLEAMVAMENIDANSDGFLELEEIFVDPLNSLSDGIQESDWQQSVIDWADDLEDAAGKISIGGKSLLDALATLSPEQVQNVLNQLMSIDWTLGDTDIASQIQSILSAYFPDVDITQGKSVFDILEIPDDADTKAEHFTEWMSKMGLAIEDYNNLMFALDNNANYLKTDGTVFQAIEKMLGLEEGDNRFENLYSNLKDLGYGIQDAIKIWDEITVIDENGKTTYTYNGSEYTSLEAVLAAREMSESSGQSVSDVKKITKEGQTIGFQGKIKIGNVEITVEKIGENEIIYTSSDGKFKSTNERDIIDYEVKQKTKDSSSRIGTVEAYANFGIDITAEGLSNVSVSGIKEALSAPELQKKVNEQTGEITVTIDGENITFAAGTTDEQIRQKLMEAIGIDASQVETIVSAISTAISTADWSPVGKAISEALTGKVKTEEGAAEGIEIGELTLKPTGLKIDTTDIEPTLGDNLAGTAEAPIDIGDIGVVSGTASELKITSIPSEGTYSPEGEGATGKITITGGISNAEGEISTITLIPVAGATSSVSGDIPVADVATVTINGTTYTVDVSQGTQTNTTMSLTGVKAGSAAVEATSYTVTFTNANGTTQTVTVQGQAQLTAVLTGAVQEGGIWKIPNVAAEADVSISEASKNSITTFFETLIDKLKNIEVSVTPAEKPVAANPQTPGSYNASVNLTNGGTQNFSNESYDGLISAIQGLINTRTANEGTYTIEKVDANGAVIESTTVTVDSNSATVTGQETKTPSDGGTKSTPVAPTTPKTGGGEAPALDTSVLVAEFQAIGAAAISAAANISTATTSLTSIDTSPITTAASRVWSLISAMNGITADAANRVKNLASAMNSIPSGTKSLTLNVTVSASGAGSGKVTGNYKILKSGNVALAKGTGSALTKGTLMGELGPELVVADGRYFTVGNDGAEFVDLPDDAIVFNHLQTQKLLGSSGGMVGTGKPVTNEKKATSLATGNISGPAMASASAALAQLRQIRAMWQSMLNASAKDLGSLAGAGGGGGGGGGGGDEVAAVLGDLDRWYNLLRQIDSLEQHITLEQAKRANMRSGYDIVKSMEKELDMLKKQKAAYEELAKRQKEYYDLRRQDLLNSDYSQIFTYDEHGLMQYVEEKGKGLDILAALNATDANGKAKMNAKQQLAYLQKIGFDTSVLTTNADGTKAKKPEDQMQNFWDGIDGWMEEMDSLYDSYHDAATSAEEAAEAMAEILQEYIDNQLEVEQKLMQAIEDREQAEIDRIQDEKDALEEASQAYIDGLNDALSKEKDMYSKNKDAEETARLQRRLAILQRSGGSTSEIKSLQEQIDSRMQDEYFNKMQDQIDAIQEASDNQLEKLQNQIDIMTEALEYQKENGLLWQEVYSMMAEWTPEQMLAFIEQYTQSYQQNSQTQNEQDSQETQQQLEMQAAYQAKQAYDAYASSSAVTDTYGAETVEAAGEDAKNAYIDAIANGGTQQEAEAAANAVFGSHSAADRDVAEINSLVGDLGLNDKLKAAYLKSYNETEGTEEEKQLAGKKAMVSLLKKSDYGEDPGVTTASLSAASTLYSTKVMRDENGDVIGPKAQRRAIKKGKSVKIYGATMDSTGKADRKAFLVNYGGKTGYIYAANVANGEDIHKKYKTYEAIKNLPSYSSGGDIDFTGLAMVHGSKNHPENILSAEHTELLKQGIFSNSNHSLAATVAAIQELAKEMASSGIANSGEQIIIQQAVVNIEPGVIANDYDAKRAGEMALEEMIKIARKSGNRTISR